MKSSKHYLWTFIGLTLLAFLASAASLSYYYQEAKTSLLQQKECAGKREIRELGVLLEQQIHAGIAKETVIANLQKSILNTDVQSEFVCMYNTQGIELCHPDPSLIGQKIDASNSSINIAGQLNSFRQILKEGKERSGTREFSSDSQRSSEIVSVYPVQGTDWMLASHANIAAVQAQLEDLFLKFVVGGILFTLFISLSSFLLIRLIYRSYEKQKEAEIAELNMQVNTLQIMNQQLETVKNNIAQEFSDKKPTRKRILSYIRDEVIALDTDDIAYFELNNNPIIARTFDQNTYSVNGSLDELVNELDQEVFYRANRQFIINIRAISNIWVYGRNQLRIETTAKSETPILISKNKVSEFKRWLDR
ncbi:LytTR family transcriptional regulator [Sphingobacterium mizutaii]|uniref:LytTR family transcriptional regulator n=1 Tax=Sphingobacterium mizutaii TaxID=1010 RepID=UPI0016252610|nr:LytTR family transcriptional regulator [Sphingobacterium mizutaii]